MKSRLRNVSFEFHKNLITNLLKRYFTNNRFLSTLSVSFFITLRCNLKCSYCDNVVPNYPELSTDRVFDLLERIRPQNPGLYITGGEPLLRKDIKQILKKAKELRFKPLLMITNALNLDKNIDCLEYLDYLIVSLDSLNNNKWDNILGVNGASERIIRNIKSVAKLQDEYDFVMVANCLIKTELIEDTYQVINFCNDNNIYIAPQPIDSWREEPENLIHNEAYLKLISDIRSMKKNGSKNFVATDLYLKGISNSYIPNCYPTLNARIYPDGAVFFPCMHLKKIYGNLFDFNNLHELMKEAYDKEKLPECTRNPKLCTRNCVIEMNLLIDKPLTYAKDCIDNMVLKH